MENTGPSGFCVGNCFINLFACFLLSTLYILSLYMWWSPYDRDHPSTIKKRFFGVFTMSLISPVITYYFLESDILSKHSVWDLLGLRLEGLVIAAVIPLLLTMVLFLGPIVMQFQNADTDSSGITSAHGTSNFTNLIWIRNKIVAPLSEEFTFRACMLPVLIQCFRPQTAVFVCPLFFGVAHFHHIIGSLKEGLDIQSAFMISGFQFFYTTLFGAYSAFLFLRTGHFVAPLFVHAFCNHMGFPQFMDLFFYNEPKRSIIAVFCVIGLVLWCFLLSPLTNPSWYNNYIYWK